jgi:hypothetical protein
VFKKQLEGTERELYEKRKRLKTAIDGKLRSPPSLASRDLISIRRKLIHRHTHSWPKHPIRLAQGAGGAAREDALRRSRKV